MYVKKIRLKNIKCFEDVTLEFPHRGDDYSGWIVLLGENGTGEDDAFAGNRGINLQPLAQSQPATLSGQGVRSGSKEGIVSPDVALGAQDHFKEQYETRIHLGHRSRESDNPTQSIKFVPRYWRTGQNEEAADQSHEENPRSGWFICGYGPFRRLETRSSSSENGGYYRSVATLFDDSIGLPECDLWLPRIYSNSLDVAGFKDHKKAKRDLASLQSIIQRLLPDGMSLDKITSERVLFRNREQAPIAFGDLSDGFRAFLSLSIDLLRNIRETAQDNLSAYVSMSGDEIQVLFEGIVLIDEADAHLHPQWQRQLGGLLTKTFPRIQFIVTTHSPFIAQEATEGGLFVLNGTESGAVKIEKPFESIQGWTASQILTSPLFGLDSLRDPDTEALVRRYEELRQQKLPNGRNGKHKAELASLEQQLRERLSAPGDSFEDMQRQQAIRQYLDANLKKPGARR